MRKINLIIICFLLVCCKPPLTMVRIVVTDKISEQPLDSVSIHLLRDISGRETQEVNTFFTDLEGKCNFSFEAQEGFTYQVIAERKHFQETVSDDGGEYENQAMLEPGDTNEFHFYLEAILPPDPDRFTRLQDSVPVNQLIAAIVSDEWSWTYIPKLSWDDVPALLQVGEDTTYIHNYPHHPKSSYQPDSIRAGLVALWMIEAIRKADIRGIEELNTLMPPSRAPVLGTSKGNPSGRNSPEQVRQAFEGYRNWWEEVQQSDREKAIRNNPLRGKGMSWM